jgi:hypothetical protein
MNKSDSIVKEADKNFAKVDGSKKKMQSPISVPPAQKSGYWCSNGNCGTDFKAGATRCHVCKSPSYQEVSGTAPDPSK